MRANLAQIHTQEPIIQKITKRLITQKQKQLSLEGRVCLINFVLMALSFFYLSFFKMPNLVVKSIVRIQWEFLWGECEGGNMAWVKWDTICKPKVVQGLGIKNIKIFNMALLSKWKWRLLEVNDDLQGVGVMGCWSVNFFDGGNGLPGKCPWWKISYKRCTWSCYMNMSKMLSPRNVAQ